ncbi:unnamed protein product [Absidia cylindrospora]
MKAAFPSVSFAAIGIMLLALISSPNGADAVEGRVCNLICSGELECPPGMSLRPAPQGRSDDGCYTCCRDQWT